MLLALVLRIAAIEAHPISYSLYNDMNNYRSIADAVLRGEWVPGHFLPAIGFSLVVAGLKLLAEDWVTAVGIYHLVISTATGMPAASHGPLNAHEECTSPDWMTARAPAAPRSRSQPARRARSAG